MIRVPRGASLRSFEVTGFDAGLNLAEPDGSDYLNVTIGARGEVVKRLGLTRLNAAPLTGAPSRMYYSKARDELYVQDGAALKKTTDFSSFSTIHTFTTADACDVTDFQTYVVVCHPVDGIFYYDGSWATATTAAKGSCVAAWQNCVLVAGDPSQKPRVWMSNLGNGTAWTTASDWNDFREKDTQIITALGYGGNMDTPGRPGLLVYKEESAYRVNNVNTLAYTTLDAHAGAAGPHAVATVGGLTVSMTRHGLFVTDGVSPLRRISQNLDPLFRHEQINFAQLSRMCADVYRDRLVFSFPRAGSSVNTDTLEFHPGQGWFVRHSFGIAASAAHTKQHQKLYVAHPSNGYVFDAFTGGSDDGAPIASRFWTKWMEPAAAAQCSFRRARVTGRGVIDVYARTDFSTAGRLTQAGLDLGPETVKWGSEQWGAFVWGDSAYAETQDVPSLGYGRTLSLGVRETSAVSLVGPAILGGDGAQPETGAWALYGFRLDYVPLGGQ